MTRVKPLFRSRPVRCPKCSPRYLILGIPVPGLYVGFLDTTPYEGRVKAPERCPDCGSPLIAVDAML